MRSFQPCALHWWSLVRFSSFGFSLNVKGTFQIWNKGSRFPIRLVGKEGGLKDERRKMKCSFVQRFVCCISATEPVYLTEWEGFLSSPDYPTTYPANASLTWIKSVSPGNRVKITIFTLQVRTGNKPQDWRSLWAYNLCCTFLPFKSPEIIYW